MKRFFDKRALTIGLAVGLSLGAAGAAFAYFSSNGDGTGSAATGSSTAVAITQTNTITGLLPGGPSATIDYSVNNPGGGAEHVGFCHGGRHVGDHGHGRGRSSLFDGELQHHPGSGDQRDPCSGGNGHRHGDHRHAGQRPQPGQLPGGQRWRCARPGLHVELVGERRATRMTGESGSVIAEVRRFRRVNAVAATGMVAVVVAALTFALGGPGGSSLLPQARLDVGHRHLDHQRDF